VTRRTLRLAHRGDWRRAPENTLPALLAALEIPACDGLEFDVRASGDGVPVLAHDDTLERVHGSRERVVDLSAMALSAFGIPTLAEVLAAVPHRAFLDVELKGDPGVAAVVAALEAGRGRDLRNAAVSSFAPATLEAVGRARPEWPRWLNVVALSDAAVGTAAGLGCGAIAAEFHSIDEPAIARARGAGLDVVAWTVRDAETFDRLSRLGVTGVCVEAAALDG
jgi:glycerophosphoryl diester phosphodiesterase